MSPGHIYNLLLFSPLILCPSKNMLPKDLERKVNERLTCSIPRGFIFKYQNEREIENNREDKGFLYAPSGGR
jgi:hypothetical protein